MCFKIYGEHIGDQPTGTFNWEHHSQGELPCAGYEDHGTWQINYHFPSGLRNGTHYGGTSRTAYIPDTEQGREVLCLLQKSF